MIVSSSEIRKLQSENRKHPNSAETLHKIGIYYYDKKKFNTAYKYLSEAFLMDSNDVVILNDYGCVSDMVGKYRHAVVVWQHLLSINSRQLMKHFEGDLRTTKSFKNDCRFHLALTYFKMFEDKQSKKYLIDYLKNILNSSLSTAITKKNIRLLCKDHDLYFPKGSIKTSL